MRRSYGIVKERHQRWGVSLPPTIIEAWEKFADGHAYCRRHLVECALFAFMQLSQHDQCRVSDQCNAFQDKAAIQRGFEEALKGLGFTVPAGDTGNRGTDDTDDDGKAVTL